MKNLFAFALVVLALLGTTVYYAVQASGARGERDAALAELAKTQKRLTSVQKQAQAAVSNAATARLQLKQVLDAIPEERDAAVPAAVRDSLCQRLRCK